MPAADIARLRESWPQGVAVPVVVERLSGGLVSRTWRAWLADGGTVVAKECPYPAATEADGLLALRRVGAPVPEVLGYAGSLLLLEYLSGPTDWTAFGAAVAALHQVTGTAYGWHLDNHSGRFVQHNDWSQDWPTFFAEHRVRVHLDDPALDPGLRRRLDRACDGPLPALLPQRPTAALTHGDLWSGNVVAGRLVDPEVSFADRELDLSCLEGDRRLPPECLSAYAAVLPPSADYPSRRRALQLHHLLLQVRHFGPARCAGIADVLDEYGW